MSDHYQKSTNITWLEYGYKLKTILVEMEPKMVRERLLSGPLAPEIGYFMDPPFAPDFD